MASVASVAVELYEFCFFLLPFPHGVLEAVPQSKVPSFCSSQTKCFSLKNLAFISLFYVKEEHVDRDELSKNSETVLLSLSEYIRLKKI